MDAFLKGWLTCPQCGSKLDSADAGAVCTSCSASFKGTDGLLDLVDPSAKVSSEGPGDTAGMAWRRRRWDELRGPTAPENAAYLAELWEHLGPDDQVVDLGCGPGSHLAWIAEFAPETALIGIDLSVPALEQARKHNQHPNVRYIRASTRRRLPLADGSTNVVLRRLAPGLPEEIVRILATGGHYIRFSYGPNHWQEVYDRLPGLPRAREDTLLGEHEMFRAQGLTVQEPIRITATEEVSLPAVLLALRSNPVAFHRKKTDVTAIRSLWYTEDNQRAPTVRLSVDFFILVARKVTAHATIAVPSVEVAPIDVPAESVQDTESLESVDSNAIESPIATPAETTLVSSPIEEIESANADLAIAESIESEFVEAKPVLDDAEDIGSTDIVAMDTGKTGATDVVVENAPEAGADKSDVNVDIPISGETETTKPLKPPAD